MGTEISQRDIIAGAAYNLTVERQLFRRIGKFANMSGSVRGSALVQRQGGMGEKVGRRGQMQMIPDCSSYHVDETAEAKEEGGKFEMPVWITRETGERGLGRTCMLVFSGIMSA